MAAFYWARNTELLASTHCTGTPRGGRGGHDLSKGRSTRAGVHHRRERAFPRLDRTFACVQTACLSQIAAKGLHERDLWSPLWSPFRRRETAQPSQFSPEHRPTFVWLQRHRFDLCLSATRRVVWNRSAGRVKSISARRPFVRPTSARCGSRRRLRGAQTARCGAPSDSAERRARSARQSGNRPPALGREAGHQSGLYGTSGRVTVGSSALQSSRRSSTSVRARSAPRWKSCFA
jgi:hypothetical protein